MINLLLRISSLTLIFIFLMSLISLQYSEQLFHEDLFNKKYAGDLQKYNKENKQNNEQSRSSDVKEIQNGTTTETSDLELFIDINNDPIIRGNEQTITVSVIDKHSKEELSGIEINGLVKYASKTTTKSFSGITDDNGKFSYSWKIAGNSKPGLFEVMIKSKSLLDNTPSILEDIERFEVKSKVQ
jgi:hypothetical protein